MRENTQQVFQGAKKVNRIGFVVAAAAMFALAGGASAAGNANGKAGCSSTGAPDAKNPGQFFQTLRDNPVAGGVLLGKNPAELANLENTSPGFAGEGQTPNVGAFIGFFCGSPS